MDTAASAFICGVLLPLIAVGGVIVRNETSKR
jgi:hypothetical protein